VTRLARALTIGLKVAALRLALHLPVGSCEVLTWAGLRSGISVALALSLPPSRQCSRFQGWMLQGKGRCVTCNSRSRQATCAKRLLSSAKRASAHGQTHAVAK
jgi:hypothetical protein